MRNKKSSKSQISKITELALEYSDDLVFMNLQFLKQVHWLYDNSFQYSWVSGKKFFFFKFDPLHPLKTKKNYRRGNIFFKKNFGYFKKFDPLSPLKNQEKLLKSQDTDWIITIIEIMTKHQLKDCCMVNWLNLTPWTILATCLYMYTSWRPCFVATHSWSFHFLFCN